MYNKPMTKIIGLTGPIAAGKNAVAQILAQQGAVVIDADQVAHSLYIVGSPIWQGLVKAFGLAVLRPDKQIDRKRLAEIVFADKEKLAQLNKIVHPQLKSKLIKIAEKQKAESSKLIIINAAVLKEIGLIKHVDEVWVVMAKEDNRLKRLQNKGLSKGEAENRIKAQTSEQNYLSIADKVFQNNGTQDQLQADIIAAI